MKKLPIKRAKVLAEELEGIGIIVFTFDDTKFQYTSYGKTKKDCQDMRALADEISDMIIEGELEVRRS